MNVHWLKSWLDAGLSFVYPELCQICEAEQAGAREGYVCHRCRSLPGGIQFIRAPYCERCGLPFAGEITTRFECGNCREMALDFVFARASVAASGLVLDVIHRYKYSRALWFEPFLGDLLVRGLGGALQRADWDWIVPVPLHPLKRREREFNQAERLSVYLSRASGIPVQRKLMQRSRFTRTQTRLDRKTRAENVRGAFQLRAGAVLNGERIVLFDDVLTTGATTSACARVLRAAGASRVCVWTVARGLWA